MAEWWDNNSGLNLLKGVEGDDSNRPRLTDEQIISFLRRIPAARESFERVVPSMLPLERARLEAMVSGSAQYMQVDPTDIRDDFQNRWNRQGVRTAGPRGGTRIGGN